MCKPHTNHKAKTIVHTQKITKESKHTTKSHQATKEESKVIRTRRTTRQTENNEQNGNKYTSINNYFKYKYTKLSNKKTKWLNGFKESNKKIRPIP